MTPTPPNSPDPDPEAPPTRPFPSFGPIAVPPGQGQEAAPPSVSPTGKSRPPATTPAAPAAPAAGAQPATAAKAQAPLLPQRMDADFYHRFGPIGSLLDDDTVTEVMVMGPDRIYVERAGRIELTGQRFESEARLLSLIDTIVRSVGRKIDDTTPLSDARLADGSRVHAAIAPVALGGPYLTIRKFSRVPLTDTQLVEFGTLSRQSMAFLQTAVQCKANILISGGTGTGKTTLLNVISGFIPEAERVVTIEDTAELQLHQDHVAKLESRPLTIEGKPPITIRELVINSLRMRPDRIIVGECRGPEALDMLQAMNTGHEGSMTTVHANGARDGLVRIENMVLMAGTELPSRAIRGQIASALNIVVQLDRMVSGNRRVTTIQEITGMEGDTVAMQEIFRFSAEADRLEPTGLRPRILDRAPYYSVELPPEIAGIFPGSARVVGVRWEEIT